MYTIQELRAFHKMSKPVLEDVSKKVQSTLKLEPMNPNVRHTMIRLFQACESYDEVIDQLFGEIDRLNGMEAEKGADK